MAWHLKTIHLKIIRISYMRGARAARARSKSAIVCTMQRVRRVRVARRILMSAAFCRATAWERRSDRYRKCGQGLTLLRAIFIRLISNTYVDCYCWDKLVRFVSLYSLLCAVTSWKSCCDGHRVSSVLNISFLEMKRVKKKTLGI